MTVDKYVCHSARVLRLAVRYGWQIGARYTNLRDVRRFDRLGFLDIDWQNYCFRRHLDAAKATNPSTTVAQDILDIRNLDRILDQANELLLHADRVIIVPKSKSLEKDLEELIPKRFDFGFSVPTKYGGTRISLKSFRRRVHLLGGRPDVQRKLAQALKVVSLDCNRFTFDAQFGDYFDGDTFRPHKIGGYDRCIRSSLHNINRIWLDYNPRSAHKQC